MHYLIWKEARKDSGRCVGDRTSDNRGVNRLQPDQRVHRRQSLLRSKGERRKVS